MKSKCSKPCCRSSATVRGDSSLQPREPAQSDRSTQPESPLWSLCRVNPSDTVRLGWTQVSIFQPLLPNRVPASAVAVDGATGPPIPSPPTRALTIPWRAPFPFSVNGPRLREPGSARSTVKAASSRRAPARRGELDCGSGWPGSTASEGATGPIWRSVAMNPSGPGLPPSEEPLASASMCVRACSRAAPARCRRE
jgi:hypothetical protein